MTKRYTRRNKKGIKTKSTLLTAVTKMTNLRKKAKADMINGRQQNFEGTLTKMLMWLEAVNKCPPRHYGKVWNDEKEVIVRQCQDLYLEMQSYKAQSDAFMGHTRTNQIRGGAVDGGGRFMGMDRLRWNMATAKWDFTNQKVTNADPYWMPHKNYMTYTGKPVKVIKGNAKSWALYDLSVQLMSKEQDTADAMEKIVTPYSEWTPGVPRWK